MKDKAEVEWMYQMYQVINEHMIPNAFGPPLNVVKLVFWTTPKALVKFFACSVRTLPVQHGTSAHWRMEEHGTQVLLHYSGYVHSHTSIHTCMWLVLARAQFGKEHAYATNGHACIQACTQVCRCASTHIRTCIRMFSFAHEI